MVVKNNASAQTAFVDLATFSELEAFLYGGCDACTYFVRGIKKANWFSFLPTCLRHVSGSPNFNSQFSASVNRAGDYALAFWQRVRLPLVAIPNADIVGQPGFGAAGDVPPSLRWCRKFMHNFNEKISITFNELVLAELDSNWLDFNAENRLPESKRIGYNNMVGDVLQMIQWAQMGQGATADQLALGTGGYFTLVIPFSFGEDSGVSLPTAALPFNDIKINYETRDWQDLIVMDPGIAGGNPGILTKNNIQQCIRNNGGVGPGLTFQGTPSVANNVETWAEYAIVHNDERVKIGKAPRDILITQVQRANGFSGLGFNAGLGAQTTTDLRFSHSVIGLFWGAENCSNEGERSNYTTTPFFAPSHPGGGLDPIEHTALVYESTNRVDMDSDFYSLVSPYLHSTRVADETGYHMLSYSLRTWEYDPLGSTNYSKLANVSLCSDASNAATQAAAGFGQSDAIGGGGNLSVGIVPTPSGAAPVNGNALVNGFQPQSWKYHVRGYNWNIARISGGSLGLPVL